MEKDIYQASARLGKLLKQRGWQISSAESCTGGGIAAAITEIAGSSDWFSEAVVTYSNASKSARLQVSPDTLEAEGAVSEATIQEMLQGLSQLTKAEVCVAVSGIAGPGGGSPDKPVGTVWMGWYIDGESYTERQVFSGDRHGIRQATIRRVLQRAITLLDQTAGN